MGVRPVPVPIDADGLIPEGLDKVLAEWDEEKRGCKRPRVLYTVPGTIFLFQTRGNWPQLTLTVLQLVKIHADR